MRKYQGWSLESYGFAKNNKSIFTCVETTVYKRDHAREKTP